VLTAADPASPDAQAALDRLCRAYWFPLYAYVRRRGFDVATAQDLTQSFFADLLERHALGQVDRAKGKFRSFLLASLNNFLNNEWDKARRQKRGGGRGMVSFDGLSAEERYQVEPPDEATPERLYERRWAQAVLAQAVARIGAESRAAGMEQRFEVLKDFLMGDAAGTSYEAAAARLELSVSAVTSAIHRLRTRFREVFREEIAQTVADPREIEEEIRHLLVGLSA
jgi:RNA polymerase sigma-70 factor (ECF subfamily)